MSRTARIILATIVVLLGGIVGCCGLFPGVLLPLVFNGEIATVERLSPTTFVALEDGAPGREVLVEGTLSARNPASREGFIIYTRTEGVREPDGDVVWREVEAVRPPLLLELPGGVVRVREGYDVSGVQTRAQGSATRIAGLRAGAAVIVVGTLAQGREGIEIDPTMVGAGTRAEFLEDNRLTVLILRVFGWALIGGGSLVGGVGLLLLLLSVRRPRP